MKKIVVTILSVLTLILSSTSIVLAAPFDLTYSADSTKNYTFNQFIDRPSVFDFVAANLAGYEIEGLDGTKYNAQEINNRTMMGMTFVQAVASLHATAAVVTAEGSKLQADVDVAQALITALPVGIDKTALQDRLNIVIASMPVVPPAPSVTRNDVSDTVSGMTTAMEYNLDGAGYVAYNATVFNLLNLSGSHTLLVRVAAEGINPPSSDTTLLFTASVNEMAEIAVAAYEAGPITTLAEVATAEGLKTPADTAVAAVGDATAKAAFGLRVTTRTTVIASARTMLEAAAAEAALQAETAVAAYEVAPIVTAANITAATILKTAAESKVALVNDSTAKSAFTSRIAVKTIAMAIADLNLQTANASMQTTFLKYAAILGLDLVDYNALTNKIPVQTTMVAATFTTGAGIKTVFDTAVALQKATEAILIAFNNASTAPEISALIVTHAVTIGLNLTNYDALSDANRVAVQTGMLSPVFTSFALLKSTFDALVLPYTALIAINTASVATMGAVITMYSTPLGLTTATLTDYNALSSASKAIVHTALEGKAFATITAVNAAFGTAVSVPFINEITVNATMTAAIKRYNPILNLNATSYTTYTAPAAQLLSSQSRINAMLMAASLTSTTDVQAAFDLAVTAEAVNVINIQVFNYMDRDLRTFAAQLGLVLTDYDALINKTPVITAMVAATFTTAAQVKTTFDSLVAQQKALEALPLLDAFNTAPDAATMESVIGIHQTIFNLTDYNLYNNSIGAAAKTAIQTAMLSPTFLTNKDVQIAFAIGLMNNSTSYNSGQVFSRNIAVFGLATSTVIDEYIILPSTEKSLISSAVLAAKPIADQTEIVIAVFNSTTTANYVGTLLSLNSGLLGLDLTNYNLLTAAQKTAVQNALIAATLTNVTDLQNAFNTAVASPTP